MPIGRATYAWVLGRERGPSWIALEPSRKDLPASMDELARELAREARSPFAPTASSATGKARRLGTDLLGPVVAAGLLDDVRHLIVVAGELDRVPLEALRLEDAWVGDRWTISYAPSGTIHTLLSERPHGASRELRALVVADPPFRREHLEGLEGQAVVAAAPAESARAARSFADLRRLPRTREEASAVAALYPRTRVLTGLDANETLLTEIAERDERFAFVHLASHALVDDRSMTRTGIVLSQVGLEDPFEAALRGETVPDGFLSAVEVASGWRLDAQLVTLSACRTGAGPRILGEGRMGLSSAFLQAGARALLVSLWDVDDEATQLLMKSFYRHWLGAQALPRSKAEALRRARRELREHSPDGRSLPFEHPSFWAAFVLVGDPN